ELGTTCWCPRCGEAFRGWLRARYGSVEALDAAWGTAVWSQRYTRWEEVAPPLRAPYLLHPAHTLDYRRFASDALLALYRAERDAIREVDAVRPVTTNLMGFFGGADYRSWAGDLDVISDDSYPDPADPGSPVRAALTHDLMRSLADGPWLLMEQAVGAVSWRPHNVPKTTAVMRQDALRAVAHGADGVLSFQWRASPAGPERFHSATVPHARTWNRLPRASTSGCCRSSRPGTGRSGRPASASTCGTRATTSRATGSCSRRSCTCSPTTTPRACAATSPTAAASRSGRSRRSPTGTP